MFSGILDVAENDDGLAFILGHEVAHVLASMFSAFPSIFLFIKQK